MMDIIPSLMKKIGHLDFGQEECLGKCMNSPAFFNLGSVRRPLADPPAIPVRFATFALCAKPPPA